tara:strand:+ start:4057 stop:4833 length:777 start_codon:yes stop_codon:yes gene_type:complete
MELRPLILITNDDGVNSKGLRSLIDIASKFGDLLIVAPDTHQSGMSHAISLDKKIYINKIDSSYNIVKYSCSGTPVDCVKIAIDKLSQRKPDFCISGINHGSNTSINTIYSGTVAAALEAYINKIPSIAFSLLDYSSEADFSASKIICHNIIKKFLSKQNDENICLNVNIPNIKMEEINGIKLCKQADSGWKEDFEKKLDEDGREYFIMKGVFFNNDQREETDEFAISSNFVSVVPLKIDFTDNKNYDKLKKQFDEKL